MSESHRCRLGVDEAFCDFRNRQLDPRPREAALGLRFFCKRLAQVGTQIPESVTGMGPVTLWEVRQPRPAVFRMLNSLGLEG